MPMLVDSALFQIELEDRAETGNAFGKDVTDENVALAFSNLTAHVNVPQKGKKVIMDGISGSTHTGQVMAVMVKCNTH